MKEHEIFAYAKHYFYKLGLNTTCIKNEVTEWNFGARDITKCPYHRWHFLLDEKQTESDFLQLHWDGAIGVGTTSGIDRILLIDIDGCQNFDLLNDILTILGLPANYEWVIQSGSQNGFHIYVRVDRPSFLSENQNVATYSPNKGYYHLLEKIEFCWNTHAVLPPSLHKSSKKYEFLNTKIPLTLPKDVPYAQINAVLEKYLEKKGTFRSFYGELLLDINLPSDITDNPLNSKVWWSSKRISETNLILVFDIETDGLIEKSEQIKIPNILQLGWVIIGWDGLIYKRESELIDIKELNSNIAFPINGIDLNVSKQVGVPLKDALRKLISDLKYCKVLVSHNMEFDLQVLRYHLDLCRVEDYTNKIRNICTMQEGLSFISKKFTGYNKYPSLRELYEILFKVKIPILHFAQSDALVAAKCFRALVVEKQIKYSE